MPQHSTREAAASALLTTGPMYNGDWGRERPSVVWRVLHEGWGLPGEVRVYFPRCGVRIVCAALGQCAPTLVQ